MLTDKQQSLLGSLKLKPLRANRNGSNGNTSIVALRPSLLNTEKT
jgi:hypothetical protein